MATLQDVFDAWEVLDNERSLQAGEDDVTRGIRTANIVRRWWETAMANRGVAGRTYGEMSTTANQEYTTWPTGLVRLDKVQLLSGSGGSVVRDIELSEGVGSHAPNLPWPALSVPSGTGAPREYSPTPMHRFLWAPTPDTVYYIRYYGVIQNSAFTLASNTFPWGDNVINAFAALAARVFRTGLDDDLSNIALLADELFGRILDQMDRAVRVEPEGRVYRDYHDT